MAFRMGEHVVRGELIPGIDEKTKRMYEQWDEVVHGDKDEPLSTLFDPPLKLMPPDQVTSEEEAESLPDTLLTRLATHNVAIDVCEHFTAMETYRWLLEVILPEADIHPQLCSHVVYAGAEIDLSGSTIVIRPGDLPTAERSAAVVLTEEVARRSGIRLPVSAAWPAGKTVIAISSRAHVPAWGRRIPRRRGRHLPEQSPEGYRISVATRPGGPPIVWLLKQ